MHSPYTALHHTRPAPHSPCTTLALHHTHPAPHPLHHTHCTMLTTPPSLHHTRPAPNSPAPHAPCTILHHTRLHWPCNTAAFIAAFTSALYQHLQCSASYDIRQAATGMTVVFRAAAGMAAVHVGMASVVMAAADIRSSYSSGFQHCLPHLCLTHMHTHAPGYTQGT